MGENAKQDSGAAPGPDADEPQAPNPGPYGGAENYGSPGGDEPPASSDPGSGSAGDARERREHPTTK
jgi:hypothetical protein